MTAKEIKKFFEGKSFLNYLLEAAEIAEKHESGFIVCRKKSGQYLWGDIIQYDPAWFYVIRGGEFEGVDFGAEIPLGRSRDEISDDYPDFVHLHFHPGKNILPEHLFFSDTDLFTFFMCQETNSCRLFEIVAGNTRDKIYCLVVNTIKKLPQDYWEFVSSFLEERHFFCGSMEFSVYLKVIEEIQKRFAVCLRFTLLEVSKNRDFNPFVIFGSFAEMMD